MYAALATMQATSCTWCKLMRRCTREGRTSVIRIQKAACSYACIIPPIRVKHEGRSRYPWSKVKIIPRVLLIGRAAASAELLPRVAHFDGRNNTMYRWFLSAGIFGEHGIPSNNLHVDRHCYGAVIMEARSQWHPKNAGRTVRLTALTPSGLIGAYLS